MLNSSNRMLWDSHYKTETYNWAHVTIILNVGEVGGGVFFVCLFVSNRFLQ